MSENIGRGTCKRGKVVSRIINIKLIEIVTVMVMIKDNK